MPRQYKLRLGDGTILAVDPQGMSTWLIDDGAMVQVGGSRGWRPLKEVMAQARAAAAKREAAPAPAPTPVLPLVPPPKAKARAEPIPIIPLKPLAETPPPPPPAAAKVEVDDGMPIIPFKPLEEDENVLEELDLLIEDEEERPSQKGPSALGAVAAWFGRLTQRKGGSRSLWGDEPPARWAPGRPEPSPPPLKLSPPAVKPAPSPPPPPLTSELPTLRFAPMEKEAVEVEEVYRGPSVVGLWLKRLVLMTGMAGAVVLAVATWPTWMPMLTELSVLLFSQGQERASQSSAAPTSAAIQPGAAPQPSAEVQAAMERLPHLGPQTIQAVMDTSEPGVIAAPEVFRLAYQAAQRGQPTLDAEEARELRMLEATVLAPLRPAERDRVRAYGRISAGQDLLKAEDDRVLGLFARGVRRLPPHHRQRLQALLGKAVAAALPSSPTAPRVP